jgi:hypothetical protein
MGNQSRIRHARREFVRAYPDVGAAVGDAQIKAARRVTRSRIIRDVAIVAVVVGGVLWRCFL